MTEYDEYDDVIVAPHFQPCLGPPTLSPPLHRNLRDAYFPMAICCISVNVLYYSVPTCLSRIVLIAWKIICSRFRLQSFTILLHLFGTCQSASQVFRIRHNQPLLYAPSFEPPNKHLTDENRVCQRYWLLAIRTQTRIIDILYVPLEAKTLSTFNPYPKYEAVNYIKKED